MTYVRHLSSDTPCQLLGMIKYYTEDGCRLLFSVRKPDGSVIACNGRQIERWSADVIPLPAAASSPLMLRKARPASPCGTGANSEER